MVRAAAVEGNQATKFIPISIRINNETTIMTKITFEARSPMKIRIQKFTMPDNPCVTLTIFGGDIMFVSEDLFDGASLEPKDILVSVFYGRDQLSSDPSKLLASSFQEKREITFRIKPSFTFDP